MKKYILGIESSCDDTSAAVLANNKVLSNIIANQDVHRKYGGVVPELASRAHQQNIIPVVDTAIKTAGINKNQLDGIAFTRGPGLLGSLLVGTSFAKSFSLGLQIPLIEVDHLKAHILAHFIEKEGVQSIKPVFPFICLTVSGGHTQIVVVRNYDDMKIIGNTIDDAAGEAFDKAAKIFGLPYPGGPVIDKLARDGDPKRFKFPKPLVPDLNYSFSGLKTAILYFVRDQLKANKDFIRENLNDLCASVQHSIIDILFDKLIIASEKTGIREIAIAGGVSANSSLREKLKNTANELNWKVFIPEFQFTTDNAAMIAIAGYYKYLREDFSDYNTVPYARGKIQG